ncbi:MAG: ABC transporter ATP-binding protein [Anaerolineae bacterium]|nr:ABC transporter ATP-binding protein [Anaerolineae bacterium]
MAKLKLEHLTKDFGKVRAVNNLNLEVEDGEFLVMLGPSGAGKTTTLKLIAGVETPSAGKVFIADRLMNAIEPHKRNVAMAFESYALYPHLSVAANLGFPLRAPGRTFSEQEIDQRVKTVAETLNIHMLLDRLPQNLSNGQKQRVALGRAMVREPDVLLLDEPISHLDAKLRHRMRQEFKALESAIKSTTIYVTHDYLEAMSLGDRLVVLNKGEIQQIGKPHDVFASPVNTFVAKILGHPQINLVPCSVQQADGKTQLVSTDNSIRIEATPAVRDRLTQGNYDRVLVGIRPLYMEVVNGSAPESNVCQGSVYVYERLGTKGVLTATVGDHRLDILTPIDHDFAIDEAVKVAINSEHVSIFDSTTERNIMNG